jgi:putative SOS response-associated peptidase YedK
LVPANRFAEYAPEPNPETKKKDVVWFALNEDRPLFAFAGMWTEFNGDRGTKSKPIPGPHLVYGFLTTAPNAVVEPIHPKAMPVILTTDEERDLWMRAVAACPSASLRSRCRPQSCGSREPGSPDEVVVVRRQFRRAEMIRSYPRGFPSTRRRRYSNAD